MGHGVNSAVHWNLGKAVPRGLWMGRKPFAGSSFSFSPLQVLTRVHCLAHTRYSMNMISLGFINERQLWSLTVPVVQERCFSNISEP